MKAQRITVKHTPQGWRATWTYRAGDLTIEHDRCYASVRDDLRRRVIRRNWPVDLITEAFS